MKNSKKSVLTATLAALVAVSGASASIMAGCGTSTPDEASVIVETKVVTRTVDDAFYIDSEGNSVPVENGTNPSGEIVVQDGTNASGKEVKVENGTDPSGNAVVELKKDASGNAIVEKPESKKSDKADKKQDQSSKADNSAKTDNKTETKANSSEKSDTGKKADNTDKNDSQTSKKDSQTSKSNDGSGSLKIGGKSFNVGDTVTCTYSLSFPENIENYQGYIQYDPKYLSVSKATIEKGAKTGSIINYKQNTTDKIYFNGSYIIEGYDYTGGGAFLTVTYTVKASGSTSPKAVWEEITGLSGKKYANGSSLINGAKSSEVYE